MNVKSTRRSTDTGCWRLRYITDLGKVEIRVLADYSNSEEPQGQSGPIFKGESERRDLWLHQPCPVYVRNQLKPATTSKNGMIQLKPQQAQGIPLPSCCPRTPLIRNTEASESIGCSCEDSVKATKALHVQLLSNRPLAKWIATSLFRSPVVDGELELVQ